MKTFLVSLFSVLAIGLVNLHAQADGALPFPVNVGGQAATYKKGEPFAKLAKPVKNDAAIEITAKADLFIINVGKCNAERLPALGRRPRFPHLVYRSI